MALAIDASSPALVSSASAAAITTAAFTTPANVALVAFVGRNTPTAGSNATGTVSGAGLTWTMAGRKSDNGTGQITGGTAQPGCVEIWVAYSASALTSQTVTDTIAVSGVGHDHAMQVLVITGAETTWAGAITATGAASGLPSLALTTTAANAWVMSAATDWQALGNGTVGSGQTMAGQYHNSGQISVHFWRQTATTTTSGTSVTDNLTAPSGEQYNMLSIELRPAAGGGTNGTVNAVVATVSDSAVAPVVTGDGVVTGVAASVSAAAVAPVVSSITTVNAVAATANVAAVAPVVSGGASTTAVAATDSVAAVAPVVSGGASLTSVAATASTAAVAPVVTGGATVTAVVATDALAAIAPVVSASSPGQVNAVAATATLAAAAPVVTGGASLTAVKATLSTAATAPVVAVNATVSAVAATVAAQALPPVVGSPDAQIVAVVANLSMAAYAPRVSSVALAYTLITPVKILNYGEAGPLGHRINYPTGSSILKIGGFYQTLDYPSDEAIEASEVAYLGGHTYTISQSERDALVAAGYGAYITEVIP